MASVANLQIDQGSDFSSLITLENYNNQIINIENYTIKGQIRKTYESINSVDFNCMVFDSENGIIQISLTKNQTSNMSYGRYVYDIEITSPEGIRTRVLEGQLEINPRVIKDE